VRAIDLDRANIPNLQRRMDRGTLTAVELTEAYLDRIHRLDDRLHSVLAVNRAARAQAAASDRRREGGRPRVIGVGRRPELLQAVDAAHRDGDRKREKSGDRFSRKASTPSLDSSVS